MRVCKPDDCACREDCPFKFDISGRFVQIGCNTRQLSATYSRGEVSIFDGILLDKWWIKRTFSNIKAACK